MKRGYVQAWKMLAVAALVAAAPAIAQNRTATIVVDVTRSVSEPKAVKPTVTARNISTDAATTATPRKDGSHILAGLEPGEYLISALVDGKEVFQLVTVGVGQSLKVQLDLDTEAQGETVVVKGRLVDNATSEVAMNVTRDQIEKLPQTNRNFLNFAALTPGVRTSTNEFNRNYSSGALAANTTNVFVDGVSLKNNVIEGGVVGQDASRGNPFPQLAVGGFRVISQNYKAEYEQAGAAIITATTRSGSNDFHGEALTTFQNHYLMEQDYFGLQRGEPPADLSRVQLGAALGGPILRDRLHFFATYEGSYEQRANRVTLGNPSVTNVQQFGSFEGNYPSPFREHLGFAKLSWRMADNQTVDVTSSLRAEEDIRSFGGTTSYQSAENVRNRVFTTSARHQLSTPLFTNEATFQFLTSSFNPTAQNTALVGKEYLGVIRVGGRDTTQDVGQRSFTLRDDVTFPTAELLGTHVVKAGAKVSIQRYNVTKYFFANPLFKYRDPDYSIPFEALYGTGEPTITANNTQIGIYAQDDWQLFKRLTVNVGVRWDVETNPNNNDYVTPQSVRDTALALAAIVVPVNGADFFPVNKYLTDGSMRPPFLGAIQPRLGLAFDLLGDGSTVLFAGAGRYYDRTLYNATVDEPFRLQYAVRTFRFSADGLPRDGNPTIAWDNDYLSKEGLDGLIASGVAPSPEIFLIQNDLKPMHTDQFSAGLRRQLGPLNASLTGTYVHSENGIAFHPANRYRTGTRDWIPTPGGQYGNVIISTNDRETWFKSLQVTAEKPYSPDWAVGGVQWGASVAYTLGFAEEKGQLFNFDYASVKDSPIAPADTDERHRMVISGIVGLPWNVTASTLITLGSGLPYNVLDASLGHGPNFVFRRNYGRAAGFQQIDVRLAKEFTLTNTGDKASAFIECFNLLNNVNYNNLSYDGFIPPLADNNPNKNYGKPTQTAGPPRSLQLGVSYRF